MSEHPVHLPVTDRARASGSQERVPSIVQRIAGSQMTSPPIPSGTPRVWLVLAIGLVVGLATGWTFIARNQLHAAIVDETAQHLAGARTAFDTLRAQSQADIAAQCRLLVDDPRLKSTLATAGMDAATVADILQDLSKLRRTGFLLVLDPDGRVFAQAGAAELEGVDLSASAVVKKAHDTDDVAIGSWALAGEVMDLSIKSVRYGETLVAYLVVGQPVGEELLAAVDKQTGVAVASALANKVVAASSRDATVANVFASAIGVVGESPRVVTSNARSYVASVVELRETAQSHRLVLVSPVETVARRFRVVEWMAFAPPVLVLVAALFILSASRSPRRIA